MTRWLQITSGRGPDECTWVVHQLARHIAHQAGEKGFRAEVLDTLPGNIPKTLRSAILAIEGGEGLPEFIREWEGAVQWIGQSMFRPHHKRRNWFVSVSLLEPSPHEGWCLEEIRFERMRASGPGGQHVNKTETAIRAVHDPTGLYAVSQDARSQHLNKKRALGRLLALLRQQERKARDDFEHDRWEQHNHLERGNARHVFRGMDFKPVR